MMCELYVNKVVRKNEVEREREQLHPVYLTGVVLDDAGRKEAGPCAMKFHRWRNGPPCASEGNERPRVLRGR